MNNSEKQLDLDGYILIPNEFKEHGFTIKFIEDLGDNWRIYSREKHGFLKYELVHIRKQEEYVIAGNKVAKKLKYPSTNDFGFWGWELNSIQCAKNKHAQLIAQKQSKLDIIEDNKSKSPIIYPEGEFTLKELLLLNKDYNYIGISNEVKKNKNVQIVGERKGSKGKPAKLMKLIK